VEGLGARRQRHTLTVTGDQRKVDSEEMVEVSSSSSKLTDVEKRSA
jgi:hypothetical protein